MNETNKKTTKTPVVISEYGKEREIRGKYCPDRTFTCPICGISRFHSISILKVHAKEIHGKDIDTLTLPMRGEEYSRLKSHISSL